MSRDLDYVADILAAARLALGYVEGVGHERFLEDTMRQDAVVRELLIIGEAAKRLSGEFKARHSGVPWRQMAGMGDLLIHAYDHVDLDEVWRVATVELPGLLLYIEPFISERE